LKATAVAGLGPWAIEGSLSHDFSGGQLLGGAAQLQNKLDWSFKAEAGLTASVQQTLYDNPRVHTSFEFSVGLGVGPFAQVTMGFGSDGPHFWDIVFSKVETQEGLGGAVKVTIGRSSPISGGTYIIMPNGKSDYQHFEPGNNNGHN